VLIYFSYNSVRFGGPVHEHSVIMIQVASKVRVQIGIGFCLKIYSSRWYGVEAGHREYLKDYLARFRKK